MFVCTAAMIFDLRSECSICPTTALLDWNRFCFQPDKKKPFITREGIGKSVGAEGGREKPSRKVVRERKKKDETGWRGERKAWERRSSKRGNVADKRRGKRRRGGGEKKQERRG